MSKAYFVTSTDTEVGKTFITAGLAYTAKSQGFKVGILKPISAGGVEDAKFYKNKLKLEQTIEEINPIRFKQPLSPYAAMKKEKTRIDFLQIKETCEDLKSYNDIVFVEGLGGVLAPIKRGFYVADLIKLLNIPSIIVARAGLGTINHTLLTIEALKKRGVKIKGIILNGYSGKEVSEKTNAAIIEELSGIKVIGKIKGKSSFDSLVKQIKAQEVLKQI